MTTTDRLNRADAAVDVLLAELECDRNPSEFAAAVDLIIRKAISITNHAFGAQSNEPAGNATRERLERISALLRAAKIDASRL